MTTIRRLSDDDVRAIFESLHGDHQPPSHLRFQIVPVNSHGLKLSPPSYEFEDGLCVLLRPEKKRKKRETAADLLLRPKVPDHLHEFVMKDDVSESCPWSLSGPQFPQPTAIQQRYCYPKGNPEYSGRKGGALWTMYDRHGKEDLEFRLLHVYFSVKRAINKGVTLSEEDRVKQEAEARTPKKKRARVDRAIRSPWQETRESLEGSRFLIQQSRQGTPGRRRTETRGAYHSPNSPSPPNVDRMAIFPPPSPFQPGHPRHVPIMGGSVFVSPSTAASDGSTNAAYNDHSMFDHPSFHPVPSFDDGAATKANRRSQHPFRGTAMDMHNSDNHRGMKSGPFGLESPDSFEFNEDDATALGGGHETLETYLEDPLFALGNKHSFDDDEEENTRALGGAEGQDDSLHASADSLRERLRELRKRLCQGILAHPAQEQGLLLSIVTSWARDVAKSPIDPQPPKSQQLAYKPSQPSAVPV